MSDTLVYSSNTGQTDHLIANDLVVEHVRPKNLRVNDPRYGLKTAAKLAWDEKRRQQRTEFLDARTEALSKQRDAIRTRLSGLQAEIRKVITVLEKGSLTVQAEIDDAFGRLERMGRTETKLVSDIARLTDKIGD